METLSISDLTLYFKAEDREAAELISNACERSVQLICEHWGLKTPEDCRVYVMTSWFHFVFHAAPWTWKVLLAATLPLWSFRVRKIWPFAGGWVQLFGKRRAVGIKPPRLIQRGDTSIGERIFVQQSDLNEKVQHITCHEMTHAFTEHLRLPTWLHEGLAMVTVDKFAGKPTVKPETLDILAQSAGEVQRLRKTDPESLVYYYVHGYWLTRYLDETRPDLIPSLLTQRYRHEELENKIADTLGMSYKAFQREIDGILVSHFQQAET